MRNEIDKVLIVGGEKDFHDIIQNSLLYVYLYTNYKMIMYSTMQVDL